MDQEPQAAPYFRRWLGADEFLNGYDRWCLWLGECPPEQLRKMPEALKRVEAVRQFRLASQSAPTRKLAETPTRFHVENRPDSTYLVIPEVSSERRFYLPLGFLMPDVLCSNKLRICRNATLYHFGILSSVMHMAWMRAVCGRLKSDYQYSVTIVYNNFPWPEQPSPQPLSQRERGLSHPSPACGRGAGGEGIATAAQAVLDARASYLHPSPACGRGAGGEGATLADLYDPRTMPPELVKAHRLLDRAVDAAYGKTVFVSEAERVAFLFARYQQLTSLLPAEKSKRKPKK